MFYRFSYIWWISRSKLTLNNFTSKPAASINPTTTNDDDPFVTLHHQSCMAVCDGTQNVGRYRYFFPVPNIFDTDTGTFFGTKFFLYRFRDFFSVPIFSDITKKIKIPGTGTSHSDSTYCKICPSKKLHFRLFTTSTMLYNFHHRATRTSWDMWKSWNMWSNNE